MQANFGGTEVEHVSSFSFVSLQKLSSAPLFHHKIDYRNEDCCHFFDQNSRALLFAAISFHPSLCPLLALLASVSDSI